MGFVVLFYLVLTCTPLGWPRLEHNSPDILMNRFKTHVRYIGPLLPKRQHSGRRTKKLSDFKCVFEKIWVRNLKRTYIKWTAYFKFYLPCINALSRLHILHWFRFHKLVFTWGLIFWLSRPKNQPPCLWVKNVPDRTVPENRFWLEALNENQTQWAYVQQSRSSDR